MATRNSYVTLAEFKAVKEIGTTDTTRDAVLENILVYVSRYIDGQTGRRFYPYVRTQYYNVPDGRTLILNNDLLEVLTLTNGDGTVLSPSDYFLLPYMTPPYWGIKSTLSTEWRHNSKGDDFAISLLGLWGYHENANDMWKSVGTLNITCNDTTLSIGIYSGHSVQPGYIVKVDNEIMQVVSTTVDTMVVERRGDNGSTAASHTIDTVVKAWMPMEDIKQSVIEMTQNVFARRFGEGQTEATITAAGVVLTPKDISRFAEQTINRLRKAY